MFVEGLLEVQEFVLALLWTRLPQESQTAVGKFLTCRISSGCKSLSFPQIYPITLGKCWGITCWLAGNYQDFAVLVCEVISRDFFANVYFIRRGLKLRMDIVAIKSAEKH